MVLGLLWVGREDRPGMWHLFTGDLLWGQSQEESSDGEDCEGLGGEGDAGDSSSSA